MLLKNDFMTSVPVQLGDEVVTVTRDPPTAREMGTYEDWAAVVYTVFLELSHQRASTEGVSPLSMSDIKAYFELNRLEFGPLELDLLLDLDRTYVDTVRRLRQTELEKLKETPREVT